MGKSSRILFTVTFLAYLFSPVQGGIIPFPGQFATIQESIEAAGPGDTILIAEGHYYENIDFLGKEITLASQYILDGDTAHIINTVIDGSHFTDSLQRSTIIMRNCKDTTSVVKGLTIIGGGGTQIFVGPSEHWCGGDTYGR